jgi:signal transduction histidine kinase
VRQKRLSGLTIRTALFLGFGLTLGLWLFAGYHFTKRMAEVGREAAAINVRYMHAQELLSTVRSQVLLASVYVRDALLDPNRGVATSYLQQVQDTYRGVDDALVRYVPVLDSAAERERVGRLRREIDEFRQTMLDVLSSDSTNWPADARNLLQRHIVPKREAVMRVSEEVQALNRASFVQQQADISEVYRVMQRQVWQQLGIALAASLAIALLAIVYAGRLENRLQRQRETEARNTRDLQRLSAQLINAQEEERRSIARELHDEVGQVLTAIKVELAVAQRTIASRGDSVNVLEDAQAIADGAIHTVRDLSHLLHPAMLDDLGLPAAIDSYLRGFRRRHGIQAELLHGQMDERLAPQIEAAGYRIVQEALTNVAKHAKAMRSRVYLQRLARTVLITIEDDGTGFDVSETESGGARKGLGLISMRERVSQLQGTMRIESAPGKGTRVTVELPALARRVAYEAAEVIHG